MGNVTFDSFTLRQLQENYTYIDWVEYVNSLLPPSLSVDDTEVVYLYAPSYFKQLGELLYGTKPRVIANYLMWCIIYDSMSFLKTNAEKTPDEKREKCIEMVKDRCDFNSSQYNYNILGKY